MKSVELELKKRLFVVEADKLEEANEFFMMEYIKPSAYRVICKGSDLTEEIAKSLVKNEISDYLVEWAYDYKNNEELNLDTFSCLESFISAIESKGYHWDINPYQLDWDELCEWGHGDFSKDGKSSFDLYHEAESKTFNPDKTLIFEIIRN